MELNIMFFFFNDTATTEIYTLSLHDALPICPVRDAVGDVPPCRGGDEIHEAPNRRADVLLDVPADGGRFDEQQACLRSEEHTSELQSRQYLVCRLLLEKKKQHIHYTHYPLSY